MHAVEAECRLFCMAVPAATVSTDKQAHTHTQYACSNWLWVAAGYLDVVHQPLPGRVWQRWLDSSRKLFKALHHLGHVRGCGWIVNKPLQLPDACCPAGHCSIGHGVCANLRGRFGSSSTHHSKAAGDTICWQQHTFLYALQSIQYALQSIQTPGSFDPLLGANVLLMGLHVRASTCARLLSSLGDQIFTTLRHCAVSICCRP